MTQRTWLWLFVGLAVATAITLLAIPVPIQSYDQGGNGEDTGRKGQTEGEVQPSGTLPFPLPFGVCTSFPENVDGLRNSSDRNDQNYYTREDLKAQQATACFTEWIFYATTFQFLLACLGTALLLWSLRLNRKATNAAVQSAQASERQARYSLDSFRRLERPYIHFSVANIEPLSGPNKWQPHMYFGFANHGKSPAIVHSYGVRLQDSPVPPLRVPPSKVVETYEVIEPGRFSNVRIRVDVDGAERGQSFADMAGHGLRLLGWVSYGDQMGATHTDYFCLRCVKDREFTVDHSSG